MYFYRATCYGGCRNGAEGAGGGGLKSADCRAANWRPAAARGSPVRGSPTSMLRMVVGDPEPTPQRPKPPLRMRQSPGAKRVRDSGGWEKQTSDRSRTGGESEEKWMRRKAEGKEKRESP